MTSASNPDEVNVQEIIKEIKRDISEKYSEDDLRAFDDISIEEALKNAQPMFDKKQINAHGIAINGNPIVAFYRDFPGGRIARCAKKVVRKLISCVAVPIVNDQNTFNQGVADAADQMSWFVLQQQTEIDALRKEIEELKKKSTE